MEQPKVAPESWEAYRLMLEKHADNVELLEHAIRRSLNSNLRSNVRHSVTAVFPDAPDLTIMSIVWCFPPPEPGHKRRSVTFQTSLPDDGKKRVYAEVFDEEMPSNPQQ